MEIFGALIGSWAVVFFFYWLSKKVTKKLKKKYNAIAAIVIIVLLCTLLNPSSVLFYGFGGVLTWVFFEMKRS